MRPTVMGTTRLSALIATAGLLGLLATNAPAQLGAIRVESQRGFGPSDPMALADQAVRNVARRLADVTRASREALQRAGRWDTRLPFSTPFTVILTRQGRQLASRAPGSRAPGPLTIRFETSGSRAFPSAYKDLLQATFDKAKPTLDALFGQPSESGDVWIRNFDADISDRDAVAGGYYVNDNGSGQREIRFPEYNSNEAATVNLIHCLLLAYLGPKAYQYDAFQEGVVRAVVMRTARTSSALPAGLDPELIDGVLENSYETGTFYDWWNQTSLGGPVFIAPNLRNTQLPAGGSLGGVYLARYKMAGTAWQKVLVEYPAFAKEFNQRAYNTPGSQGNVPALITIGQQTIDFLAGSAGATIEGLSFAEWFRRQAILQTGQTVGSKLLATAVPITSGLSGSDFAVFLLEATYFQTNPNGDEVLLSATSYPVFWEQDFNRVSPSAQDAQMDIAGSYGAIAPNLPNLYNGQNWRCAFDLPVGDRLARIYLPAGSIARAATTIPNNFYGTVIGIANSALPTRIRLTVGSTVIDNIAVQNGTFGALIASGGFDNYQRLRVEVIQTVSGSDQVLFTRLVNKGPGPIGLDLRIGGESSFVPVGGLSKGISLLGVPILPFIDVPSSVLGVPDSQILMARYNPTRAAYDLFPSVEPFTQGHGFFLRLNAAQPAFSLPGRTDPGQSVGVALKPGWNLISNPLGESVPTSRIQVVRATEAPQSYASAVGVTLGSEFFTFQPGAPDPISGVPEGGTMVAATTFEPGRGYFVRVLAPEGLVMLFEPATLMRKPDTTPKAPEPPRMILEMVADDGFGSISRGFVGQSTTATNGFDPREDSGLPPGIGGFQLSIGQGTQLYRDMRPLQSPATFVVRLDGLTRGNTYLVRFRQHDGFIPFVKIYDPRYRRWLVARSNSVYRITASGPSFEFQVQPIGVAR